MIQQDLKTPCDYDLSSEYDLFQDGNEDFRYAWACPLTEPVRSEPAPRALGQTRASASFAVANAARNGNNAGSLVRLRVQRAL